MKKLPASCAVVVFLAVLAYQAQASIVVLTRDTRTQSTPNTMQGKRLAEYDQTTLFPDKDLLIRQKVLDGVFIRDNNDITLSILGAMSFGLPSDGSDLPEYNPIIDIAVPPFDEDLSAGNDILDAVYIRDNNGLILPTIPAAMSGSLILEEKGFPEYNPMPVPATRLLVLSPMDSLRRTPYGEACFSALFSDKDLFAVSEILGAVYVRNNDNIIQPTTSGAAFIGLTFKDTYVPGYDLITNIATLFFDEDLFAGNQLIDMVYIPGSNIIPSAASDAALGSLTFENKSPIEYSHPTNIAALHLGESIFANIGTFYITADSFVIPEPSPIAILGLGSLYLLRKRKGLKKQAYAPAQRNHIGLSLLV